MSHANDEPGEGEERGHAPHDPGDGVGRADASPPPGVEVLRADPRLVDLAASLFWATFPDRRLGQATVDGDGRVPLTTDAPWSAQARERWLTALDRLLQQPVANAAGAYLREVRDRRGRRDELALPVSPGAYRGGAWLVGPFVDATDVDAWAATTLRPPWVHDAHGQGRAWYADVFSGDPGA